jgi:hypothetical protein
MSILWLSLGENCLSQYIIDNNNLNTKYTPFSWTGTTIEMINKAEEDDYKNFFNFNYFSWEPDPDPEVPDLPQFYAPVNTFYSDNGGRFSKRYSQGFRFAHHKEITFNKEEEEKIEKRLYRLKNIENQTIVFVYNYTNLLNNHHDPLKIRKMLQSFKQKYEAKNNKVFFLYFYQNPDNSKNTYKLVSDDNGIFEFEFTCELWGSIQWKAVNQEPFFTEIIRYIESRIDL